MEEIDIFNLKPKDLETFLKQDTDGEILKILDSKAIERLKQSSSLNTIISHILEFSNFKDKLLENEEFIDALLKCDKLRIFRDLKNISIESSDNIIKKCLKLGMPTSESLKLLKRLNPEYQMIALDRYKFSNEAIHLFLGYMPPMKVIKKIINKYRIDLTNENINIDKLFQECRFYNEKEMRSNPNPNYIYFNDSLFTPDFLEKIWNNNGLFKLRLLINDIGYSADTTKIEEYVKRKENEIIYDVDETTKDADYKKLITIIESYSKALEEQNLEEISLLEKKYYKLIEEFDKKNIYIDLTKAGLTSNPKEVRNYFQKETQKKVSNSIIDYHFEDNYHNVIIDIKELLEFYRRGNIELSKEKLSLYNKIINIDELSLDEKRILHEQLKQINIKEEFYDDIRLAKDIASKDIKDSCLNASKLEKYYDERLSQKYGIRVYNLTGQNFVGLAKTGRNIKNENRGGHSFCLVGDEQITVYGDPHKSDTYFYDSDSLLPDQIVHEYPTDSYSYYNPTENSNPATSRTYKIRTSRELLKETKTYNEILVLEKGTTPSDMDERIPLLKKLGLYCIDDISKRDVSNAKLNGVGIIYLDSVEHKKTFPKEVSVKEMNELFEDTYLKNGIDALLLEEKRK